MKSFGKGAWPKEAMGSTLRRVSIRPLGRERRRPSTAAEASSDQDRVKTPQSCARPRCVTVEAPQPVLEKRLELAHRPRHWIGAGEHGVGCVARKIDHELNALAAARVDSVGDDGEGFPGPQAPCGSHRRQHRRPRPPVSRPVRAWASWGGRNRPRAGRPTRHCNGRSPPEVAPSGCGRRGERSHRQGSRTGARACRPEAYSNP